MHEGDRTFRLFKQNVAFIVNTESLCVSHNIIGSTCTSKVLLNTLEVFFQRDLNIVLLQYNCFFLVSLLQLDAHAEEMTSDGSVWQTVISGHVFTYSAFIDERPQKPVVKVAAEIYLSKYATVDSYISTIMCWENQLLNMYCTVLANTTRGHKTSKS